MTKLAIFMMLLKLQGINHIEKDSYKEYKQTTNSK